MDPALAIHVTMVLKGPVPLTVALHPINWLDWMGDGKQLAVTLVTVDGVVLEPQAANQSTVPTASKSPNLRILSLSLMDVTARVIASRQRKPGTCLWKLTSPVILALS
jgi:hypothetical protein